MSSLIAYRKVFDAVTTHVLRLPVGAELTQNTSALEIATLADGRTIVWLPIDTDLPASQPAQIQASIDMLPSPLPASLRDEIRAASPHVALLARRMIERIRGRYTPDDEAFFARIGAGVAVGAYTYGHGEEAELLAYMAHVESARQWRRAERAKLGL